MSKKLEDLRARTRAAYSSKPQNEQAPVTQMVTHYLVPDDAPDHVVIHWGGGAINNLQLSVEQIDNMITSLQGAKDYILKAKAKH